MKFRSISIGFLSMTLLGMVCYMGHGVTAKNIVDFVGAMLFMLPFYGFPPIVSIVLSARSKCPISQVIPAGTSLLYGIWFAIVVYDSFYVHLDAQSGLVMIFVGIYFLPVLLPLWIVAHVMEKRHRKKGGSAE